MQQWQGTCHYYRKIIKAGNKGQKPQVGHLAFGDLTFTFVPSFDE